MTFILLVFSTLIISCRKEKTAERALIDFISYRFQENQSRDALLEQTHGRLKNLIAEMDEVEFKKYASVDKLQKKSFLRLDNLLSQTNFLVNPNSHSSNLFMLQKFSFILLAD